MSRAGRFLRRPACHDICVDGCHDNCIDGCHDNSASLVQRTRGKSTPTALPLGLSTAGVPNPRTGFSRRGGGRTIPGARQGHGTAHRVVSVFLLLASHHEIGALHVGGRLGQRFGRLACDHGAYGRCVPLATSSGRCTCFIQCASYRVVALTVGHHG